MLSPLPHRIPKANFGRNVKQVNIMAGSRPDKRRLGSLSIPKGRRGTNIRPIDCAFQNMVVPSMTAKEREIYCSANGDRWILCREDDHVFVLHRANESSGGKLTPVELGDFLRKGN